jgi:hypothetical protein
MNISEDLLVSVFRVRDAAESKKAANRDTLFAACSVQFSVLKMETVCSSETQLNFYDTIWLIFL